jgi:hypothetical protein
MRGDINPFVYIYQPLSKQTGLKNCRRKSSVQLYPWSRPIPANNNLFYILKNFKFMLSTLSKYLIIWRGVKTMKLLISNFSPTSYYFLCSRFKYSPLFQNASIWNNFVHSFALVVELASFENFKGLYTLLLHLSMCILSLHIPLVLRAGCTTDRDKRSNTWLIVYS